jgi:hypothetical protein
MKGKDNEALLGGGMGGDAPHSARPPESPNSGGATPAKRKRNKLSAFRWIPNYVRQLISRPAPRSIVHLVFALADHFEPAIIPDGGSSRAPYDVQERRLEEWCREYPRIFEKFRDHDGHPFRHTYFYPAEQYDPGLVERLASHSEDGWGEIEVHLHHGIPHPDTAENTRQQLVNFRDALAFQHGCLSYLDDPGSPRYAFVHGNFALANSNAGRGCGVDCEMQVLADTGCYADLTLPAAPFHPAQTSKINSLYECGQPLSGRAPHTSGRDLETGRSPRVFPLIIQGPLMLDFFPSQSSRWIRVENGALTGANPPTLSRLELWKRARIGVRGRPDWLFIKLHCHGMDPTQKMAVMGEPMQWFLSSLIRGADDRQERIHFVTAREMVNMVLAASDGREGNPGEYRDYRLKRRNGRKPEGWKETTSPFATKG